MSETEEECARLDVDPPPAGWELMSTWRDPNVRTKEYGPRAKPTREVPYEYDDDGNVISWTTLSDEQLAEWQRDYDADPNKHGGTIAVTGPVQPVRAVFRHKDGSEVEALWDASRRQWCALEVCMRGADVSWLEM